MVTNVLSYQREERRAVCGVWVPFFTSAVHADSCEYATCDACWQELRRSDPDHYAKMQSNRRELITKWNSGDRRPYPFPALDAAHVRKRLDVIGRSRVFALVGMEPFNRLRAQVMAAAESGGGTVRLNKMQAIELLVDEELWGYVTTGDSREIAVNPDYHAFERQLHAYYLPDSSDA
ncbi:hypothetical protein HDA32_005136 [Spinactinospora alkalitolerans]|uniref:Uncharacterized protein n=1 Tax=Spinactinospora alkalitolerans TaxID=687207 RepID=A0A852TZL7_9ACTN|nr:hypothetical protein [Spinactinospora alkalitolerans]NYE50016.1 hypothetical protein [Spinactinospora alkalitolerans]